MGRLTDTQAEPLVIGTNGDIFSDDTYDCAGDICSSPGVDDTTRFMQFIPSNSGGIGDYARVTSAITLNGKQIQDSSTLTCTVSSVEY